jgi:hypothetical protein
MSCQQWVASRRNGNMPLATHAAAIALIAVSPAALADDAPDLLNEAFKVSVGTFGINSQPTVQLRGEVNTGDRVNFNEEIGGGDSFRGRIDAQWRFAERHKAYFAAFGLNRSNTRVLDRDIEWGDQVYPLDATARFSSDFWVLQAVYDYSFLRRENYELGASIGLHWTSLSASVRLKLDVDGNPVTDNRNESASVDVPLPVVGVRGLWKLPYDFWLEGSAQYFALSINEYDGNLQDYRVFLTWQPRKWVGLGVGYERFTVDVDVDKSSFNGTLDWTYDGPIIFYSVSF